MSKTKTEWFTKKLVFAESVNEWEGKEYKQFSASFNVEGKRFILNFNPEVYDSRNETPRDGETGKIIFGKVSYAEYAQADGWKSNLEKKTEDD